MAVIIPNVTNWSVTPQNGQEDYFTKMNIWLSESTNVIASLNTAITKINESNTEINDNLEEVLTARDQTVAARNEAVTAVATLTAGAIDNTTIAPNKAFSNQYTNDNFVKLAGNQTIAGVKTFNSTIVGSINGNAATVTNGVYTTGNQTIAGIKTFSSSPIVPTPTTGDRSTKVATTAMFSNEFTNSLSGNGYQKLPGGLIIQWGQTGVTSGSETTVTLPISYPNVVLQIFATRNVSGVSSSAIDVHAFTLSNTQIKLGYYNTGGGSADIMWMTLGS